MAGLDRVKGPHWSQILAMFGPGGTINETLKDRNQVQLKDKARNLKLFFLKSGIEVPYYLQFVTGELKTRAPAQAMKNEQRDQSQVIEDRAHVGGVMALAGSSLQDPEHVTSGMCNDGGDAEEGDVSMEDEAPDQNGGLPLNSSNSGVLPAGREQQQHLAEQEYTTSRTNGVYANGQANYGEELVIGGYQALPGDTSTVVSKIKAVGPV